MKQHINRIIMIMFIIVAVLMSGCNPKNAPDAADKTPVVEATLSPTSTVKPTSVKPPTETPLPTAPVALTPVGAEPPIEVSPVGQNGALLIGTDDYPWWNDAVMYEVFVRSFYDSNGDGIGDIPGLIQKLDYLNDGDPDTDTDLGVTGLWLMPIMQSPSYHGYDVVDYYTIEEDYGTNEDFLKLVEEAHKRGIHIIIDLVLNHTSTQHPWFKESLDPASPKRNWYVWSDKSGSSGWYKTDSGYYYAIFWDQMPDLNYTNPEVTEAVYDIIRFWLEEMQVDGFRLDAIKHLVEENNVTENTPGTLAWLEAFFDYYKSIDADAYTVGEVWSDTTQIVPYVGDKVDMCFEFNLADTIVTTSFNSRKMALMDRQKSVIEAYPDGQFATFLANHDQSRTRSQLVNDGQAKTAASIQLTFPGVPYVYYGEEIGMQGAKPDENIRRPMQWTSSGGFTTGQPWHGYFEDYPERNVAAQSNDPESLLAHYDTLIHLRNLHEALRIGSWIPVDSDARSVVSHLRVSDQEIILTLINMSGDPVRDYALSLASGPFASDTTPTALMGSGTLYVLPLNGAGGFDTYRPIDEIPGYGTVILQFAP